MDDRVGRDVAVFPVFTAYPVKVDLIDEWSTELVFVVETEYE